MLYTTKLYVQQVSLYSTVQHPSGKAKSIRRKNARNLHVILTPMTPGLLPSVMLLLILYGIVSQSQPALDPFLASHLGQAGKRTREREALLVTTEDRCVLQRLDGHAEVVHEIAHGIG